MSDRGKNKGDEHTLSEANAAKSKSDESLTTLATKRTLPRRALFSAGLLGVITQACSNTEFGATGLAAKQQTGGSTPPPGPGKSPASTPGDQPLPIPSETDIACNAVNNPAIDVPPNIPEKAVTAVFYGRQDSALLALMLPAGEDVKQVVIATAKGKLMALHGITGADKKGDGSWRPIVIDSLPLIDQGNALNEVVVLMQLANGRAKAVLPINFMTKFQDKVVVDLSGRSVPASMIGSQSVAQFGEQNARNGGFAVDNTLVYPNTYNSGTVRNLYTAKPTSTWSIGAGLVGTITDIMGNVIDRAQFSIIEHQVFCTYVNTADGKVARTMIHVG